MGRPSKLTPERQERIVLAVSAGSYPEVAARANGVDASTFYRWMARGDDPVERDPRYRVFREAVKEAEARAEVVAIGRIQQAAAGGTWTASAWYLERKYPDRWGRKDQIRQEVSGPGGGPVEVDPAATVLSFLDRRREQAEAADSETAGTDPAVE